AVRRDQVDEAGVAVDRVGDEVDDRPQNAVEVERRGDRVDDPKQVPRLRRARRGVRNGHSENSTWVGLATPGEAACRLTRDHPSRPATDSEAAILHTLRSAAPLRACVSRQPAPAPGGGRPAIDPEAAW